MNNVDNNVFLLAISIGPVQGFIASARKTRDLWAGSFILSELAKVGAMYLQNSGAKLIFPAIVDGRVPESVANVVLVEIDTKTESVQMICNGVKMAIHEKWQSFCDATKNAIGSSWKAMIRNELWQEQTDPEDVIEFHAAAVPLSNQTDYVKTRNRVMRLLAGRKTCRNFVQTVRHNLKQGVPKSSLDGARESVLNEGIGVETLNRFMIKKGEQLDAIGLIKRLGVKKSSDARYLSLLEIAIKPWLKAKGIDTAAVKNGIQMADSLNELADKRFLDTCVGISDNEKNALIEMVRKINESGLYLAILCADGDKMGAAISQQSTAEGHRQFSADLSRFSNAVPDIVAKKHGLCVYAGGDDVLAFLPVDSCLDCAKELRDYFKTTMKSFKDTSLSVGIAIGHYHEMLEELLDFARQAEKNAKSPNANHSDNDVPYGNRNGLAIDLYSRGSIAVSVREQWELPLTTAKTLIERIEMWSNCFARGAIPHGYPYDIIEVVKSNVYDESKWTDREVCLKALKADIINVTAKKQDLDKDTRRELEDKINHLPSTDFLESFYNELYIAQTIGEYRHMSADATGTERSRPRRRYRLRSHRATR